MKPCPAARWEAPPKFPPEPAARGGRREGGAGTRGRNRDSRARRVSELGVSAACTAGQLAAAPRSSAWEREPRFPARSPPARPPEARALGPQKGRRAHGAALTALCSPVPPARPLAPRPPPPRPPRLSPGQIQRRRARGRGPVEGRGGRGRCKCYNFLRCPRPGGPGTRRGEGSARAPMSSLSFPPSLSPLLSLLVAHTFFLAHARRHILPLRALAPSASLSRLLSLSLLQALQPFKMLPLCCDSPDAAPRPPARSPAPSVARFLSLALPLPTSDSLH